MNTKSTKKSINLLSVLNTNRNHSMPDSSWNTFDDNNSPYYNEGLSPLYFKTSNTDVLPYYDIEGNKWIWEKTGALYKNDSIVLSASNTGFTQTKIPYTNADTMAVRNGNYWYSRNESGTLKIYKNDSVDNSYAIGEDIILAQRMFCNSSTICYVALVESADSYYCLSFVHNSTTEKWLDPDIKFYHNGAAVTDLDFNRPLITYTDLGTAFGVCIMNKSGADVDAYTLDYSYVYISYSSTPAMTVFGAPYIGATSTATEQTQLSEVITNSIKRTQSTSQNLTCYKYNGKYYSDAAHTSVITFEDGYTPTATSTTDVYTYTKFTTTFTYTMKVTQDTELTDKFGYTLSFNITDADRPSVITDFTPSFTGEFSSGTTVTKTLTYVTNKGGMTGDSFYKPTLVLTYGNGTYDIPVSSWTKSYTFTVNKLTNVTEAAFGFTDYIMLDDGYFYGYLSTFGTAPNGFTNGTIYLVYNFKNTATWDTTNKYVKLANMDVAISQVTGRDNTPRGNYVNIGENWIRNNIRISTVDSILADAATRTFGSYTLSSDTSTRTYYSWLITYDSTYDKSKVYAGYSVDTSVMPEGAPETFTKTTTDSDGNETTEEIDNAVDIFFNNKGPARVNNNKFKALFNSGYLSGFSYSDSKDDIGTLVADWAIVDINYQWNISDTDVVYRNANDEYWYYVALNDASTEFNVVTDRYVVLNTKDYYNAYDMKLNKPVHYASDWNNRILFGTYDTALSPSGGYETKTYYEASGENVIYNQSVENIASAKFSPLTLMYVKDADTYEINGHDNGEIDLFLAESGVPKYVYTISDNEKYVKPSYTLNNSSVTYGISSSSQAYYPNPSIFSKFIYGVNGYTYMEQSGYMYRLLHKGNTIETVLLAATTSNAELPNLETLFVIQSMPYAIIDNSIYALNISNGTYQSADCIIQIRGMQYLGSTPSTAYFWSPINRGLYTFTGDANLTFLRTFSNVSEISKTWYNNSTQTIYLATDDGLYMLGSKNMYKQQFYDVQAIYFSNNGHTYVVDKENDEYVTYEISHEYFEDSKTNKVRLDTGLYGTQDFVDFYIDRWNIQIWNDKHFNGEVTLKSFTMTDKGTIETESKKIQVKATDWDKDFNNILISYVPKYNKGMGVGLKVESDFMIGGITASVTQDVNTQISRTNI